VKTRSALRGQWLVLLSAFLAGTWLTPASPHSRVLAAPPETAVVVEPSSSAPARYMGREIATTMHYSGAAWLVRESRQREEDCQRLLKELDIRPGQVICDMGCGNGFYTLKLARLTGSQGKIYAVDIQQEMLDMLRTMARNEKLQNVIPVLGAERDPHLPEGALDLVLMVDVYHEFSRPEEMLRAIRRSLKPAGRIASVEFRAEDPKVPIKPLHKMSKQQILKEFEANGLKVAGQFDGLPWQHLMFFSRDDGSPPADAHGR
jgi:SAM-dependent methyltransferase